MIFAGIIAALSTLLIAGFGATLLLMRGGSRINVLECAALAWLFGTGIISLLLWGGGMVCSGPLLQVSTAVIAVAVGAWGFASARRDGLRFSFPKPESALQWILCAVVTFEIATIVYLSFGRGLDWDGFLNWEIKARYAFQNDGVIPATYYSSETRAFTHPGYPLLIPLTELWLYLCMGEAHQLWIKIIFPLYYAAGAILLATTANRLTSRSWPGLLAAALLFFIPFVTAAPGGATGGYVDAPLSVLYLATMAYLIVYATNHDARAWRIYASSLALLPWVKREGAILWAVAALCAAVIIYRQRRWSALLWLAPGVILIVSWKIFLLAMKTADTRDFIPMTLADFQQNLSRVLPICRLVFAEMMDTTRWSLFWPIVLLAFVSLLIRSRDRRLPLLFIAVAAPIGLYAATYLFSAWPDFSEHFASSFPRLLLHVMPVAWLAVALAMTRPASAVFNSCD
jgi:hypothetical protein